MAAWTDLEHVRVAGLVRPADVVQDVRREVNQVPEHGRRVPYCLEAKLRATLQGQD